MEQLTEVKEIYVERSGPRLVLGLLMNNPLGRLLGYLQ